VLWVVVSALGDGVTELQAINERGLVLGTIRLPNDVDVFEVGSNYLLAAYEAADGSQRVVLYPFTFRM
jgi:hypothetical protein